jgi:hypothetical protein
MLKAFADVVRDRMARNRDESERAIGELRARPREIVVPAAEVRNEAPEVTVQNHVDVPSVHVHNQIDSPVMVDAGPLAAALMAVAGAVDRQTETMDRLLEALAVQPRPKVRVEVAPEVSLTLTDVTADKLAEAIAGALEKPKRRLTVQHSDGTESTITEK